MNILKTKKEERMHLREREKISIFHLLICILIICCKYRDVNYDVLIKNAQIVDGTGRRTFKGNIAIIGEKIVELGRVKGKAKLVIDASGYIACPGFFDTHSHADLNILEYPLAENFIMQGVTTVLGGNCGFSQATREGLRFNDWIRKVEKTGVSINLALLIGHADLRHHVMGEDFKRTATNREIELMKGYVEEAMKSGAFGLSSTLEPSTAEYASVKEIVELLKIVNIHGGIYSPHTRHMQNHWWSEDASEYNYAVSHTFIGEIFVGRYHGVLEAIEISKKANNTPLLIAHFFPVFITPQPIPGFLQESLARATLEEIIDKAHSGGLKIFYNIILPSENLWGTRMRIIDSFYKPPVGHTINAPQPPWYKEISKLSREEFIHKLKKKEFRNELKEIIYSGRFKFGMVHPLTDPYWMDCFTILSCLNKNYEGKTIGQLARERSPDDIINAVYNESLNVLFDILEEDAGTIWYQSLDKRAYDGSISVFLKHPFAVLGIDSLSIPKDILEDFDDITPGFFATFPFFIRRFVIEKKLLTLEEAIMKATSIPFKKILGIEDRGILRPGTYADLVLFDLEEIKMRGDYQNPSSPPEGIKYVLINGEIVYKDNEHTGKKPGKVIRRK